MTAFTLVASNDQRPPVSRTLVVSQPSGPRPSWVPAIGQVKAISGPGTDAPGTMWDAMYKTPADPVSNGGADYFGAWASGVYVRAASNVGAMLYSNGGNGDYHGTEIYMFNLANREWTRECERAQGLTGTYDSDPNFDGGWLEHIDTADGSRKPASGHNYDQLLALEPQYGGGARGSVLFPSRTIVYRTHPAAHGHSYDIATKQFKRINTTPGALTGWGGGDSPSWCFDTLRGWAWGMPGGQGVNQFRNIWNHRFDSATGMADAVQQWLPGSWDWTPAQYPTSQYWPTGDKMVSIGRNNSNDFEVQLFNLADASGPFRIPLTGDLVPWTGAAGYGFAYVPELDCFYIRQAAGAPQDLWKLTPGPGAWNIQHLTMSGDTVTGGHYQGMWKRFSYASGIGCLTWTDDVQGNVYAYRVA